MNFGEDAQGYITTGNWTGAIDGALSGGLLGGAIGGVLGAGLGFLSGRVCFVAGTQVVTGLKVKDENGRIKTITARELSMEAESGGGRSTATAPKIVGYITANIEDLKEGDSLIIRDEHDPDGPLVARRITRKYKRVADHLKFVGLRDDHGRSQAIQTTDEHPFYVLGQGFIKSQLLAERAPVAGPSEVDSVVSSNIREPHPEGVTVYNMEVKGAHTYFVRAEGSDAEPVWVHNAQGYSRLNNRRLSADRPSSRYQEHVTGKSYEEYWQTPGGNKGIDGRRKGFLVEAKWAGRNNAAFANDQFYNPAGKYYDEKAILAQAQGYLKMDQALSGNGVRYAMSNDAARIHFKRLFQQHFPEAVNSGSLSVYHVPGNGMR